MRPALIVLAKAPRAGHVKTRLCPPCTPEQAAALAEAALRDTLAAAAATAADRRVLCLDGEVGDWLPDDFEVVPQRGTGLAARLAAAFADVDGPALLVGMDTPQLSAEALAQGLALLVGGARAVLGLSLDGGYWAIGLQRPDVRAFADVPMSSRRTGAAQRARLVGLGLTPEPLAPLRDVDTIEDARAVAEQAPHTRFAAALACLELQGAMVA